MKQYRHKVYVKGELKQTWIDNDPTAEGKQYQGKKDVHYVESREVQEDSFTEDIHEMGTVPNKLSETIEDASEMKRLVDSLVKKMDSLEELIEMASKNNLKIECLIEEHKVLDGVSTTLEESTNNNKAAILSIASKLDAEDVTNLDTDYESNALSNY